MEETFTNTTPLYLKTKHNAPFANNLTLRHIGYANAPTWPKKKLAMLRITPFTFKLKNSVTLIS